MISLYLCDIFFALCTCKNPCDNQHQNSEPLRWNKVRHAPWYEQNKNLKAFGKGILNSNSFGSSFKCIISFKIFWHFYSVSGTWKAWKEEMQSTILNTLYIRNAHFNTITNSCQTAVKWIYRDVRISTKDNRGQVLTVNCSTVSILFGVSGNRREKDKTNPRTAQQVFDSHCSMN